MKIILEDKKIYIISCNLRKIPPVYDIIMGKQQSKDQVVIAQTATGSSNAEASQSSMPLNEILIILVVVLLLASIGYYLYKKCRNQTIKTLRRELTRHQLANNNASTYDLPTTSA